jgi:methyl-accepting chemotaxis protein
MKLRKKLIVILVLISIVPVLAGIGIILLQTSSAIRHTTRRLLSEYSSSKAGDIFSFFERTGTIAQSVAFFPRLAEMNWPEKKSALGPLLAKIASSEGIRVYLYANTDGTYYRSDNPGNPARRWLVTADNTNPDAAPNLLNERDYFRTLVTNNPNDEHRVCVSNPILSLSTGQKQVIVGSSVIDTSGKTAGMLGLYIEDRTMEETLNVITAQIRQNFEERLLFLIFSENNVILSRREYDPGTDNYTERALNVNQEFTVKDLDDSLRQACETVTTGSSLVYRGESGEQYYMTSSAIGDTGYRVVLSLPVAVLDKTILHIQLITVIVLIATVLAVGIIAFLLSGQITNPIIRIVDTLHDVSQGDLTKEVGLASEDEIGDLARYVNFTVDNIKSLVASIKKEADALSQTGADLATNMTQTAAAVNEITASIQNINDRILKQSVSVTETKDAVEQIRVNIDNLSGHVECQGESLARSSSAIEGMLANIQWVAQSLIKNSDKVKDLNGASGVGHTGLQEMAADIQEINRESQGLWEINVVMQNIASQTNMLSMNAAIEAAHAGEAGRGFSVVADEIRKLAENSGEQAKTIRTVLKKIQDAIDKINKSTNSVLGTFEAIDQGVGTVAEQEENIRNAMEKQGLESRLIREAIGQLNDATQLVKDGSGKMLEESRQVIQESRVLDRITAEIRDGMQEMVSGAQQINGAINRVNDISGENKKQIEQLMAEVSRFKVA